MEPAQEITWWLTRLHLPQYASSFARAGYHCFKDLRSLTEEKLYQMDNIPTGHRRRILSSLETLMMEVDGGKVPVRRKPIPRPRQVFPKAKQRGTSCQYSQGSNIQMTRQTLPSGTIADSERMAIGSATLTHTLPSVTCHTVSSSSGSASEHGSSESLENFSEEPIPDENDDFSSEGASVGFQGEMVENEIYERCTFIKEPSELRSTRSYKLRHRPVPEIPEHPFIPPYDWTLSPIAPYGELFLYNSAEKESKQDLSHQHDDDDDDDDDYSTVQESTLGQRLATECSFKHPTLLLSTGPSALAKPQTDVKDIYSKAQDDLPGLLRPNLPSLTEVSISPYACFYGTHNAASKAGWLDKLSPQGNCVFQRRWVKLEGGNLTYYNSDKEMYSKGLIPISAVKQVRALGENKFEVVTSIRTFVFRAEKEGERQDWLEVLQSAVSSQPSISHQPRKNNTNKSGYVELRGLKGRVYLSLMGTSFRLCKTDQDFNAGLAITVVDLTAACVKQVERKGFEITTPFKSFCFTVDSEREREEWIEAVQESIVETLCNYEVLEKVWFNRSNRECADCQAPEPEWASINLCVVICKNCAGQHRFLGPGISKVRSMKLDSSIWTNELIELFLDIGNKNSNSFWEANLPPEEELCMQPSLEQRASFIHRKYKKRKYKKVLEGLNTKEELNKALCATVVLPDILQTMALVFSGADVMCATGDPQYSTPYLLAQKAGQRLQMEFLYHNKLSGVCVLNKLSLHHDVYRPPYFAISREMHATTYTLPFQYALLRLDNELIGRLHYKEGHDLYHWRMGWFALVGSELYFCSGDEDEEEGVLQLKRLQELTVSTHMEGDEKIQVLIMVESGRTVYIHGITKQDFALWHSSIQLAAGTDGMALGNQQMNKNDVPIIVDSCIAFVTQYGLCYEGIYQKNGDPGRVAQLLQDFTKNARVVKLRAQDHRLGDVTDTLKSFLSHSEDALLAKELYPFWISALDEQDEKVRVQKYSSYIQSLPKVNRSTLGALLQHLYRIQRCSHINQMNMQNLACIFSSCLFQTEGHTAQETRVVEDLINNYIQLFSFSPAGDLIFEVYLEKNELADLLIAFVSPSMRSDELAISTLEMKGMEVKAQDLWTTFEVIENGEMERPLHYNEKILEQVLEWSSLEDPSSAFLLIKKYSDKLKDFIKGEQLKFKDGSSKLLLGNKFQDRYLVLQDKKLLLYKDIKSTKPEREAPLKSVKCYLGLRRKLKPTMLPNRVFLKFINKLVLFVTICPNPHYDT
uniref:ArfGAP with RhoGAP domain, ankyrin repeat and PH domain 2 n=1 Tax=Sinocyclocheilus grahami TaxID=75366 RepID=A0A672T5S7_SINGR